MRELNFKSKSEAVKIAGREYTINTSSYEFIKAAQANLGELEKAQKEFAKDTTNVDVFIEACKTFINFALDNDFDRIWEAAEHDLSNLIEVIVLISELVNKGFAQKVSKYV